MHPLFARADARNVSLGLLFNFHELTLVDGMSRLALAGAIKN
jgi:hypothetical protein